MVRATLKNLPHRTANLTSRIIAPTIVTENIPTAHAVFHLAILILAIGDVFPQDFHFSTVWSGGTATRLCITL